MLRGDSLIAKIAIDLVDTIQTADGQPLLTFAFRPAKLWPELLDVTRAKHVDIESWPSRNCSDIGAVSVVVSDDLGQNQIVLLENAELKSLE